MMQNLSTTCAEGSLHSLAPSRGMVTCANEPSLGVIFLDTWIFVSTGSNLSMDMAFGKAFSSIIMTLLSASKMVAGTVVRDIRLLHGIKIFLPFANKASGGRFT